MTLRYHLPLAVGACLAFSFASIPVGATPERSRNEKPAAEARGGQETFTSAGEHVATVAQPPAELRSEALGTRLGEALTGLNDEPEQTAARLKELLPSAGLLEDVVYFYLGRASESFDSEQASLYYRRALNYPDTVVAPQAAAALAELLLARQELAAVLELAARFDPKAMADPESASRIALAAAKASTAAAPRTAATYLMHARESAPGMQPAKEAVVLLRQLREEHPELRPQSSDDIYAEAVLTGREGNFKEQIALLDDFLARFSKSGKVTEAVLLRGRAVSRHEGREQAAAGLARQAAGAPSSRQKAQYLYAAAVNDWNAHDSSKALAKFDTMLALETGVSEEQRAWYAIGRIHEAARRYTAAASAYRRAQRIGSDAELEKESKWRAGWVSYLAGNYDGAAWVFGEMADQARLQRGTSTGREEALYWEARSLEKAGRTEEAAGVYRTLLKELPDGYYAFLVERRGQLHAEPPSVAPLAAGEVHLPGTVQTGLERARQLTLAGLDDLAVDELARVDTAASPEVRRALLPHMLEIGAYPEALKSSLRLYQNGMLQEDQLYPFLYPHAFAEIVAREAGSRSVDPFLVYSLIRQESLFDRRAVSPASAYGLMQLLLPTAQRMAPRAGLKEVELEDLFRPEINVRLGVTYLAELSKRFDDNPALVLASYNAGERAADRWKARLEGLEFDEFVEQISYSETRNYVKKILRNYRNYRRLYGDPSVAASVDRGQQSAR